MTPGPYTGLVGPYPRDPATGALLLSLPDQSLGARKLTDAARDPWLPAGAVAQNIPWWAPNAATIGLTSGQMRLCGALLIPAGRTVNTLTFGAGNTALATGSNQWAALYTLALALIGVTADRTNTAWGANAQKPFTLAVPFAPTVDTIVVPAIVVVATTPPSLAGVTGLAGTAAAAPLIAGQSSTGQTTPGNAPASAAAPASNGSVPYCLAS